ncbi:hypothetical protein TrLO_g3978 [Triparma laevis f. longispina]|nr:hypothetical protein TrLO_g3978 [Triparma laevis f. longispina]
MAEGVLGGEIGDIEMKSVNKSQESGVTSNSSSPAKPTPTVPQPRKWEKKWDENRKAWYWENEGGTST